MTGSPIRPLVLTTFCLYFGFGLVSPVVPLFARGIGAGVVFAGVTVAGFSMASFAFDLVGGRLSDRFGVRRTAATGAAIVVAATMLAAGAPNVWILLLSRVIAGAGSAVYVTTAMNVLARTTPPERMGRAMSMYQTSVMLGIALGPSVGGVVAGFAGLRAPFVCYAAVAALAAAVSILVLPSRAPRPAEEPPAGGPAFRTVARDGAFLTALATTFVVFILRAGVSSTAVPLYAHEVLGLGQGKVGLTLTLAALSNVLFLPHAGRLADRRPRSLAIAVGLVATLVSLGILGLVESEPALYLAMFILGIGMAYAGVTPAAVIADITPSPHSAVAMGAYRMAVDSGSVAGPVAAGVLASVVGAGPAFLFMAVPAALTLVAALRLRDTRPPGRGRRPSRRTMVDDAQSVAADR